MNLLVESVARVLRPLIRVLIARGVRYPELCDWIKVHYLTVAERDFQLDGKRVTDSRLHVLTGLQRKDIKALRARQADPTTTPQSAGPVARVIATWLADIEQGGAQSMPRLGDAPSFEALVARVSRDIHARTIQDELVHQGLARVEGDDLRLIADAYVPSDDDPALLAYLGANLGDHAEAAVSNVQTSDAPFFERAVHYNHLTPAAISELDALSRDMMGDALQTLNARAAELQARDRAGRDSTERFRCGAFVFHQPMEPER